MIHVAKNTVEWIAAFYSFRRFSNKLEGVIIKLNFETVLFERRGQVAIIVLNRPEVMNSINAQLYMDAGKALEIFKNDSELLEIGRAHV